MTTARPVLIVPSVGCDSCQSLWPSASPFQPSRKCVLHITQCAHTQFTLYGFFSTSPALQPWWCVLICSHADVFSDAWASVTDLGLSWCTTWLVAASSWPLPAYNEYSTTLREGSVDRWTHWTLIHLDAKFSIGCVKLCTQIITIIVLYYYI